LLIYLKAVPVQFELRGQNAKPSTQKEFNAGTIEISGTIKCQSDLRVPEILLTLNFFASMALRFGSGAQIGQALIFKYFYITILRIISNFNLS